MNNKVSIIVPAYNNGEYIGEALDSVIAQTYPHWECIVVDDGSTDNTREVAQLYCTKDSRISYLYQDNAGPSVARNNGIAHTSGHYILPLDSDDKIAETYLEKAVAYFDAHPETALVYCRISHFGMNQGEWNVGDYNYQDLIYGKCIIFCTAMYKRTDYDKTSGYNPNMRHGYEDWDFWLTLLNANSNVHKLDEILFFYRSKHTSRSTILCDSFHTETYIQLISNHKELYDIDLLFDCYKRKIEFEQIKKSFAYRIGKSIIRPFSWLKRIFINRISNKI